MRGRVLVSLAFRSLANRRLTAGLTVLSVAVSVALLIGVDRLRTEARTSFTSTISGADLIVGARSGPINLLLYSVFRIGDATNNISWDSYGQIAARPGVAWTIPISLGDAHRGFRVLGTDTGYFTHYRFGRERSLELAQGAVFARVNDAVLGADVANALGYAVGDRIIVSHGIGDVSFEHHDELPFLVTGILRRTGTPVDRTVHVTLAGIEAIHAADPRQYAGQSVDAAGIVTGTLEPDAITACIVGLNSRLMVFSLQRFINEYEREPLMAIVPGVTLQQLWELVGVAEMALLGVSAFVIAAGLVGLLTTLLTSLAERRREMAVLRSMGAGPGMVFGLLVTEAVILAGTAAVAGVTVIHAGMFAARPFVLEQFGLYLAPGLPGWFDGAVVAVVTIAAGVIAALPAWRAYRYSLADGLSIRT
ncbi:MAG: ABC transporter permease [Gammaproteobacteria bacterium]|nr:ABC transporter permease [Gammaproteobacteria bacterium]